MNNNKQKITVELLHTEKVVKHEYRIFNENTDLYYTEYYTTDNKFITEKLEDRYGQRVLDSVLINEIRSAVQKKFHPEQAFESWWNKYCTENEFKTEYEDIRKSCQSAFLAGAQLQKEDE